MKVVGEDNASLQLSYFHTSFMIFRIPLVIVIAYTRVCILPPDPIFLPWPAARSLYGRATLAFFVRVE